MAAMAENPKLTAVLANVSSGAGRDCLFLVITRQVVVTGDRNDWATVPDYAGWRITQAF